MTAMLLLSGCATKVYNTELEVYCPPKVEYSDAFNEKLVEEILNLPLETYAIEQVVADYVRLRDLISACDIERDRIDE